METAQVNPGETNPIKLDSNLKSLSRINKYILALLVFLLLIIAFESGFYFYKTKQLPWQVKIGSQGVKLIKALVKDREYLVSEDIIIYDSPDGKSKIGYIISGKYFQVLGQKGEWIHIQMTRIEGGQAGSGWIKFSETAYRLAGNK